MDGDTARTSDGHASADGLPASDGELARRVRDGGPDAEAAFAALHNRHHAACLRHARRIEPDADAAEDLVSDAFVEVLAQLRRGGGPRESFRAYLCATMRNAQIDRAKARKGVVLTGDAAVLDTLGGTAPQPTEALPDLMMVQQAFGSLPDRWQAVLWHTEVEGEKPRHVAGLLGLTPNAVSQLAVRAREGLSEAFLKAHIGRLPDHCRDHGDRLGGYVRGTLRIRDRRALDDHLADCPTCTRLCAELVATNAHLRVLLLPAVLGASAAAAPGAVGEPARAVVHAGASTARKASIAGGVAVVVAAGLVFGAVLVGGSGAPERRQDQTGEQGGIRVAPAPPTTSAEQASPSQPAASSAAASPPRQFPPVPQPSRPGDTTSSEPQPQVPPPDSTPQPAEPAPGTAPPAPEQPPATPPPTGPTTAPTTKPTTGPTEPTTGPITGPITGPTAGPTTGPTSGPHPTPGAAMAVDDAAFVTAGNAVALNLFANDRGDKLRIVGMPVAWGRYGRIQCDKTSGACTYRTWSSRVSGTDAFRYTVRDAKSHFASATIRITVVAPGSDGTQDSDKKPSSSSNSLGATLPRER